MTKPSYDVIPGGGVDPATQPVTTLAPSGTPVPTTTGTPATTWPPPYIYWENAFCAANSNLAGSAIKAAKLGLGNAAGQGAAVATPTVQVRSSGALAAGQGSAVAIALRIAAHITAMATGIGAAAATARQRDTVLSALAGAGAASAKSLLLPTLTIVAAGGGTLAATIAGLPLPGKASAAGLGVYQGTSPQLKAAAVPVAAGQGIASVATTVGNLSAGAPLVAGQGACTASALNVSPNSLLAAGQGAAVATAAARDAVVGLAAGQGGLVAVTLLLPSIIVVAAGQGALTAATISPIPATAAAAGLGAAVAVATVAPLSATAEADGVGALAGSVPKLSAAGLGDADGQGTFIATTLLLPTLTITAAGQGAISAASPAAVQAGSTLIQGKAATAAVPLASLSVTMSAGRSVAAGLGAAASAIPTSNEASPGAAAGQGAASVSSTTSVLSSESVMAVGAGMKSAKGSIKARALGSSTGGSAVVGVSLTGPPPTTTPAPVTYTQGIDFRDTAPFVTDDTANGYAPETTWVGGIQNLGPTYPHTTPQGHVVGWEQHCFNSQDSNATIDHRLAGFMGAGNSVPANYRFDLPAPGSYLLALAVGDLSYTLNRITIEVWDNLTLLATIFDGAISTAGHIIDAAGIEHTSVADWVNTNSRVAFTFASTIMRVKFYDHGVLGAGDWVPVRHLAVVNNGVVVQPPATANAAGSGVALGVGVGGGTAAGAWGANPGSTGPTKTVGPGQQFSTFAAAITSLSATVGGTLLVAPGTYTELLHIDRPITIRPNNGTIVFDYTNTPQVDLDNNNAGLNATADCMIDCSAANCGFELKANSATFNAFRGIYNGGPQGTRMILLGNSVVHCHVHDCQNGYMSDIAGVKTWIYNWDFWRCSANDQSHPVYCGDGPGSFVHIENTKCREIIGWCAGGAGGQYLKIRALVAEVINCDLGTPIGDPFNPCGTGADNLGSRMLDVPAGGQITINGGRWYQQPNNGQAQVFGYGTENMNNGQFPITFTGVQFNCYGSAGSKLASRAGNTNVIQFNGCTVVAGSNHLTEDFGAPWGGSSWLGIP